MRHGMIAILPALALLPSTLACSSATDPDDRVSEARTLWDAAGLTSYEYDFSQSCFCVPIAIEPVRVSVANNVVVGAVRVRDGQALPDEDLTFFSTVDELFDRLEQALEQDPEVFEVLFDADLGYPTSANVDISFMIADEEYSFTASGLSVATGP